jgi:glycosyl transferase family 25
MPPSIPPIFVISLAQPSQSPNIRRDLMQQHLQEFGYTAQKDFEFIDAIDGRQMDIHAQSLYRGKKRRARFGKDLTGGEWGCFQSHLKACQILLDRGLSHALILEDDARLDKDFHAIIKNMMAQSLPYDLIRLFGSAKIARKKAKKIVDLGHGRHLLKIPSLHGGAHATLMTARGAQRLLNYVQKHGIAYPIDTLYGRVWELGITSYAINPLVTPDEALNSTIEAVRFDKSKTNTRPLLYPLTRAWHKTEELVMKKLCYYLP